MLEDEDQKVFWWSAAGILVSVWMLVKTPQRDAHGLQQLHRNSELLIFKSVLNKVHVQFVIACDLCAVMPACLMKWYAIDLAVCSSLVVYLLSLFFICVDTMGRAFRKFLKGTSFFIKRLCQSKKEIAVRQSNCVITRYKYFAVNT